MGLANQKFSSIKNDFSIVFDKGSQIFPIKNDAHIQNLGFSFTPINKINDFEQMRTIDLIGVIEEVGNIGSINLKSGQSKDRRNVTLVDNSGAEGCSISATLWSDNAQLNNYRVG